MSRFRVVGFTGCPHSRQRKPRSPRGRRCMPSRSALARIEIAIDELRRRAVPVPTIPINNVVEDQGHRLPHRCGHIAATRVDDDGLVFDVDTLEVHAIREDNRYGGLRAVMLTRLGHARIHVQIDVGFGDAITPPATDLEFPTLLTNMPSQTCWPIRPKPSSPKRSKRWSISASRTAA